MRNRTISYNFFNINWFKATIEEKKKETKETTKIK